MADALTYAGDGSVDGDQFNAVVDHVKELEGNGGSQSLTVTRVPFTFDTPGLIVQGFTITAVDQGAKKFTVAGDHAAVYVPAALIMVTGSSGNDGVYTIVSSTFAAGSTDIVVIEAVPDNTADGFLTDTPTAGITAYTPAAGEILLLGATSVTTPFDFTGSGIVGNAQFLGQARDPATSPDAIMVAVDITAANAPFSNTGSDSNLLAFRDYVVNNTTVFKAGVFADSTPLVFYLDDQSAGPPGVVTQGAGEVVLLTVPPS